MAYVRAHETNRRRNGKAVKRYEVVWREQAKDTNGLPIPGKLRSRQESFATREQAEERRDALNNAKHTLGGTSALADARQAASRTYAEYAAGWLASQRTRHAEGDLKIGTLDNYEKLLSTYVLNKFGHRAIGAITLVDCEEFRAQLAVRLRPGTVRNVWWPFSAVFHYAARAGAITTSPADAVDRASGTGARRGIRFRPHPITAPQVAALAEKVGEHSHPVYGLMILFLCYTGLRRGELQGVEVRDLTLTHSATGVRGSVRVERTKVRRKGVLLVGTPKSDSSVRTVPLPPWLAARMAGYLDEHPRADSPTAPLFPNRAQGGARRKGQRAVALLNWTEPVELRSFARRTLRDAQAAIGLPLALARKVNDDGSITSATNGFRLHDTRHTFAVMQLSAGVHFMQVSKWLGHSTYVITMTVYADYLPQDGTENTLPEPMAPATESTNVVQLPVRQVN